MKTRITAVISFIGAVGWILFGIFILVSEIKDDNYNDKIILPLILIFVPAISGILYIIWTQFGNIKRTELENIEYENQILKRKIEQKILLNSLEEK